MLPKPIKKNQTPKASMCKISSIPVLKFNVPFCNMPVCASWFIFTA
ncbi:hypothetical protein CAMGR0001_2348 [Campylobacter gracilis RM3268]|uniref:Uncharacterized protein n=1 Tax=Campylobacter gracilis RM3268 TaxID=553220 RepID=C8PDZ8_9BACT|nr:hypothetical protein CAMGR0001_2348 [Campylobacter gracilis RM3268]